MLVLRKYRPPMEGKLEETETNRVSQWLVKVDPKRKGLPLVAARLRIRAVSEAGVRAPNAECWHRDRPRNLYRIVIMSIIKPGCHSGTASTPW